MIEMSRVQVLPFVEFGLSPKVKYSKRQKCPEYFCDHNEKGIKQFGAELSDFQPFTMEIVLVLQHNFITLYMFGLNFNFWTISYSNCQNLQWRYAHVWFS